MDARAREHEPEPGEIPGAEPGLESGAVEGLRGTVRGLSASERRQIESVLVRLSAEVRGGLQACGLMDAGPAQLSRALGLDRATSHRLLEVARDGSGSLELVGRAPGPQALASFAQAIGRAGAPADVSASILAGAQAFERMIRELGRSKASLLARIRAGHQELGQVEDDDLAKRRRIFESAASLRGAWAQTRVDLTIMRSGPRPEGAEALSTRAFLGLRSRAGAMPVRMDFRSYEPDGEDREFFFEALPGGEMRAEGVMREFSSDPAPLTVMKNESNHSAFAVDPQQSSRGPVDVVLAQYAREMTHPRMDDPPDVLAISLVQFPVRTLVHDLWLSRDLAGQTIPQSQAYFTIPPDPAALERNWIDRMPGAPAVTLLGQGLSGAACRSYARQQELIGAVCARVGWNPRDFVGYRIEVEYPLYGGMYLFHADFAPFSV